MPNTIKIDVEYNPPNPPPNPPPPASPSTGTDSITSTAPPSSISGTGNSGGVSINATEPNNEGGTDERATQVPIPPGCTFSGASIEITLDCNGSPITLSGRGTVSVSGRIEGSCMFVTEVNSRPTGNHGGTITTTKNKKRCCPEKKEGEIRQ